MKTSKSRYYVALIGLSALTLLLWALTRFSSYTLQSDTSTVELGFDTSQSERAKALDEALLTALERGYFNDELRQRLQRPTYKAQIPGLWADTCEVKQSDFERFASWHQLMINRAKEIVAAKAAAAAAEAAAAEAAATAAAIPADSSNIPTTNPEAVPEPSPDANAETSPDALADSFPNAAAGATTSPDASPDLITDAINEAINQFITDTNTSHEDISGAITKFFNEKDTSAKAISDAISEFITETGTSPEAITDAINEFVAETDANTSTEATADENTSPEDITKAIAEAVARAVTDANTVADADVEAAAAEAAVEAAADGPVIAVDPLPLDALRSSSSGHRIAGLLNSPASGVNYAGAAGYCKAAGGRLPWADEWEALAVGSKGRLYPWGDIFNDTSWPYQDAYRNAAQQCGTHPSSSTPAGVHDMAGNVMEWSRGKRGQRFEPRRRGAHGAPAIRSNGRPLYALSSTWLEIEGKTRSHHLGFRCVYDEPPPPSTPWRAKQEVVPLKAGEYRLGMPSDLRLARVAVLLPASQRRSARQLVNQHNENAKVRNLEVSRCEVSRSEYQSFLQHPLVQLGLFANEHEPSGQDYTPQDWARQIEKPKLPVSGVNWWAADAFTRWAGGRLPRVEEWQLFAAGANANRYPWGDDYEVGLAANGDLPTAGLQRCGSLRDQTDAGINDLAGNVSEWTLSVTAQHGDYAAWVQGGNWVLPGKSTARSVFGRAVPLNHRSPNIGFRVVYD